MTTIDPGSPLGAAAEEFFRAARAYRDAMKRYARRELGGVIFITADGGECVVYSESQRYTRQLSSMTFDRHRDEVEFVDLVEAE